MLTLSNLSTDEQIVLNLSVGTPQASNIPSKICRWFNLITYSPILRELKISETTFTHSASGNMGSNWPAISKSYKRKFISASSQFFMEN